MSSRSQSPPGIGNVRRLCLRRETRPAAVRLSEPFPGGSPKSARGSGSPLAREPLPRRREKPKREKILTSPHTGRPSHQGAYRAPLSASRASSSMPSPRATSAHVPLTRERVLLPPRSWRLLHRILPGETEPPHSPHSPAARLHGPRPQRTDSASRPGGSRNCLKPMSLRNPERRRMAG